ncbi:hypothetical protein BX666DRAFT_1878619 [Dichotomocladium elegans]|nr:hypothetical protein BX666DRAFT_1878619 [Dichotomocladium elegans]
MSTFVIRILLVSLLAVLVSAQLATNITNPPYNGTVKAGEKVTIKFEYGNVGTGNYTVDISLWNDALSTQLIRNITSDMAVEGGNSTGVQLNYTLPASYDWTVDGDLKYTTTFSNGSSVESTPEIIYLTVTTEARTAQMGTIHSRSRAIMLHYSAAAAITPSVAFVLLAIFSVLVCRV